MPHPASSYFSSSSSPSSSLLVLIHRVSATHAKGKVKSRLNLTQARRRRLFRNGSDLIRFLARPGAAHTPLMLRVNLGTQLQSLIRGIPVNRYLALNFGWKRSAPWQVARLAARRLEDESCSTPNLTPRFSILSSHLQVQSPFILKMASICHSALAREQLSEALSAFVFSPFSD